MSAENAERKPQLWRRIEGDRILLNQEATAHSYGASTRTIWEWVDSGCPAEGRGWYDPTAIIWWRDGSGRDGESEAGATLTARKLKAETEYRERKAEREQRVQVVGRA